MVLTNFTVIGGPASQSLAKSLARKLDAKYIRTDVRIFPDGESKVTIDGKPVGKTIVVQSAYPPIDSNFIQVLSLISKAKETSSQVFAVIPYLCYMRQDKEFLPGEIITSAVIAKMLKAVGADKIVTVDIHSELAIKYFDVPVRNVSAVPKLALFFKKMKLKDPLIVAPDLFWAPQAKQFAKILDAESIAINKQRSRKTGKLEIKQSQKRNFEGRDIILVDDMISTGGSIVKATEYLKQQNCGRIYAACTHALLVGDAEKKIRDAGILKIISANTIPGTTNAVDVSDILAKSL
ncbi:ribose-phosphate diphosphokinase [Candidatus Nitrosotenuis chungbukensis]|uniref:ribose-phosphate diphosphokinase n=1 Tax=Candidatus Nitrosotenuis chungbukensis TaxID=1353246 RepID=UPI000A858A42|nr:ribose-phosphate diphosphokinase [Candidatus Nitrosotenuis chungbukensis]